MCLCIKKDVISHFYADHTRMNILAASAFQQRFFLQIMNPIFIVGESVLITFFFVSNSNQQSQFLAVQRLLKFYRNDEFRYTKRKEKCE